MVRLTEEFAGTVFAPESTLTYGGSAPASPIADNPFSMPEYSPPPPATLTPPAIQPNPFAAPEYTPSEQFTVTPSPIQENPFTNTFFIPEPAPQPIMGGFDMASNLANQFTLGQQQEALNNGFVMRGYEDDSFTAIDPAEENAADSLRASLVMENPLAAPAPQPWAPDIGAGLGLDMFSTPQPEVPIGVPLTPETIGTDASSETGAFASDSNGSSLGQDLGGGVQLGSNAADLRAYAREVAQKYGLDPTLFEAQIQQESGFRLGLTSSAGAQGIAQFMPGTAASMGVDVNDPFSSLEGAARLMRQLLDQFGGDIRLALAAYNAGPGAVEKYGGVPPFAETQAYVNNISNARASAGVEANGPGPSWSRFSISQGFGPTDEPLDSGYGGYAHFNKGLDFAMPVGTPIDSPVSGTVVRVETDPGNSSGWGVLVWVRDAAGNVHNFGHLSRANVQVGQTVNAGDVVGLSGNTGKSTGPHLSYDVMDPSGNFIDPSGFVGGETARTLTPNPNENPFDPTQAPQRSARILPFFESEQRQAEDDNLRSIFAQGLEMDPENRLGGVRGGGYWGDLQDERLNFEEDEQAAIFRNAGLEAPHEGQATVFNPPDFNNLWGGLTSSVLPDAATNWLPNNPFLPLESIAEGITSPLGLATLPLSTIGASGRVGLTAVIEVLQEYGSAAVPMLAAEYGPEWAKNPTVQLGLSLVGGLGGGLAGMATPAIGRAGLDAAEGLPGIVAREAGETPFSARATGLQPGVGAIDPATGRPFELQGLMGGADEAIPPARPDRTSHLKAGETVTNRQGAEFTVEKNFDGTVNGFVTVRDQAGTVSRKKSGMLQAAEEPVSAGTATPDTPLTPRVVGEPTEETAGRALLGYTDEASSLRLSGQTAAEISQGRSQQLKDMYSAMDEADGLGLTGAENARHVLSSMKGTLPKTLPNAVPEEQMGVLWNMAHLAGRSGEVKNYEVAQLFEALGKVQRNAGDLITRGDINLLRRVYGDELVDAVILPRLGKAAVVNVADPGVTRPLAGFEELAPTTPPMLRPDVEGNLIPERPLAMAPEESMRAAERPRLAGEQKAQETFWTGVQRAENTAARQAGAEAIAPTVREPEVTLSRSTEPPRGGGRETPEQRAARERRANEFPEAGPIWAATDSQLGLRKVSPEVDRTWRDVTGQPAPRKPITVGRAKNLMKDAGIEALTLPRALKSGADISAPGRQGIMLSVAHPKKFAAASRKMIAAWRSEEAFLRHEKLLDARPNARVQRESGLFRAKLTDDLNEVEEAFVSKLAGKIPLIKRGERAYVAFLNEIRAGVFDQVWDSLPPLGQTADNAKTLAGFVNSASGRGSLPGVLGNSGKLLSMLFFAPRYLISRPESIYRAAHIAMTGPKAMRVEAMRVLATYFGGVSAFLAMGQVAGLWDVEWDPRSGRWGKLTVGHGGNTFTVDPWAGHSQIGRALARFTTGTAISAKTGSVYDVKPGDVLTDFARTKLSPLVGEVVNQLKEKDFLGNEVKRPLEDPLGFVKRLYAPIALEDLQEGSAADGWFGVMMSLPNLVGLGSQVIPASMVDKLDEAAGRGWYEWLKDDREGAMKFLDKPENAKLKAEWEAKQAADIAAGRAEIEESHEIKAVGFNELEAAKTRRDEDRTEAITRFGTHQDGAIFRQELEVLDAEYRASVNALDSAFTLFKDTGELPDDPLKAAEYQWYALFDKAPIDKETGKPDFDWIEQERSKLKASFTPEQNAHIEAQEAENFAGLPPELQDLKTAREAIADSGWFDLEDGNLQFLRDNPDVAAEIVPLMEKYGYSEMTVQAWNKEVKDTANQQADDAALEAGDMQIDEWAERTSQRLADAAIYKEAIYEGLDSRTTDLIDVYFAEMDANRERNGGFIEWDEMEAWEAANPGPTAAFEARPVTGLTPKAIELRQSKRDLSASGYYDLYDQAWEWLGMPEYESFDDFEQSYLRDRTQEIIAEGVDPRDARVMAASEFEGHPINSVLSELKNQGLEWPWLVANSRVAYEAWRMGVLELTQEQQYWITDLARTGQLQ